MNENNLFNQNQHGFRSGKSCLSQLLEQHDLILNLLDKETNVDVVYLDFSKAFDKVDHSILLTKFKKLGITGKIYNWIESFLKDWQQTVVLNGVKSKPQEVTPGVPQGSVLGPLISLIFIGDIDENVIHCPVKSLADETHAAKSIRKLGKSQAAQNIFTAEKERALSHHIHLENIGKSRTKYQ